MVKYRAFLSKKAEKIINLQKFFFRLNNLHGNI